MKITIIAGARPNFMKIAPILRAIQAAKEAALKLLGLLVFGRGMTSISIG